MENSIIRVSQAVGGALINVAALAICSGASWTVHEVSDGVSGLVAATDLRTWPPHAPALLRRAWCLESRRDDRPLFGSTVSLGGYSLGGRIYLVGVAGPMDDPISLVANVRPNWGETDLDTGRVMELVEGEEEEVRAWAHEAFRFAVTLGVLMEADCTPLEEASRGRGRKKGRGSRGRGNSGKREWSVTTLRIGKSASHGSRQAVSTPAPLDKTGLVEELHEVRGHLKRQACGKGRRERRWIYVAPYQATRWVAPKRKIRITE